MANFQYNNLTFEAIGNIRKCCTNGIKFIDNNDKKTLFWKAFNYKDFYKVAKDNNAYKDVFKCMGNYWLPYNEGLWKLDKEKIEKYFKLEVIND